MSHLSKDADIGNGISCYVNFLQAKEQAGQERATLTHVFAADQFAGDTFRLFNQVVAAQNTFLCVFESSAMTQSNAASARQAQKLAGDARASADAGGARMQAMQTAMLEINTGSAEETAAAAEELNGQALLLKDTVAHLQALADGRSARSPTSAAVTGRPASAHALPAGSGA